MILIFHPVCLNFYLVRPQTKAHLVLREEEKHGQSFGQAVQCLSIQNSAALRTVIDMVAETTL